MRRIILAALLAVGLLGQADAFEPFKVEDIRVEGLRRIAIGTVFNYLPVNVRDTIDPELAQRAIRDLYQTGFFQDVQLNRDGNVLIVEVVERPAIARVELRGNKVIPDDTLLTALKDIGLAEGRVFNRFLLSDIERELRTQYLNQGRYDMKVESTVSPLPRNRVGVRIDIHEGEQAQIRETTFIGNEAFSDKELKRQFDLGPKPWYNPLSRRAQYSRERLRADLEQLTSFYHDQGFINFTVASTQVSLSPDREDIYVTINVSEGKQYRIGEVDIAGDTVVDPEQLKELVATEPGALYSRHQVSTTVRAIRERLGNEGYAFAEVNPVPELDEQDNTVKLTYFVDPGSRVYVRRINISGNYRTRDEVLRREFRQLEGGWLSNERLERSRTRLDRSGFYSSVEVDTQRVPGSPDQVDVEVKVEERLSGSLQAGVGYGDTQGVLVNFSVEQDNLLGTGDRLSFAINNSSANQTYTLSYTDRYHSIDGISRRFNAGLRDTDASQASLSDYSTRTGTLGVGYGIPLSDNDVLNMGFDFEHLTLYTSDASGQRIKNFEAEHGSAFDLFKYNVAWTRDSRNRGFFPTRGAEQRLGTSLAGPGSDLEFYRLSYDHKRYFPVTETWTLALDTRLSYGDGYGRTDILPFFENYYAGGIATVRGYSGNSLGPKDDNGRPLGGNARVLGSIELIFPPPLGDVPSLRTFTFVDGGNVFDTHGEGVDLGDLRYSTGFGLLWMSPLGPLGMSWGWALNPEPGDRTQRFQFSLGTFF